MISQKTAEKYWRWQKNMYSDEDRMCPICNREISADICYEIVMCLTAGFKPSSVPEVEFKDNKETRTICDNCPYSDLS